MKRHSYTADEAAKINKSIKSEKYELYYDLTAVVSQETVVFLGDPEYTSEDICSIEKGSQYHLCRMQLGNHTGTHIDFPAHVIKGGKSSSDFPIESLIGSGLINVFGIANPSMTKFDIH